MKIWLRLSWLEWWRSARYGKDNRDYFWLTVLLFLTLTLALLLWGARSGLLEKFVDVSIGRIEGAGIPVWLASNTRTGIDRKLLNKIRQEQQLEFFPYREVESHEINLPTENGTYKQNIWHSKNLENNQASIKRNIKPDSTEVKSKNSNTSIIPFEGWAVALNDPLWQMEISQPQFQDDSGLPLEVVLNLSLFKQYFDCAAYQEVIQTRLPFWKWSDASSSGGNVLSCLDSGILWLDVNVNAKKELIPFYIRWQAHIPTMQKVAFLFPLSTFNALRLSRYYPEMRYYPEAQFAHSPRVWQLIIRQGKMMLPDDVMTTLQTCLKGGELKNNRLTWEREQVSPLPEFQVVACIAQQSLIPLHTGNSAPFPPYISITEQEEGHYFKYDSDDYLTVLCADDMKSCNPCDIVPSLRKVTNCLDGQKIDMIHAAGSYQKAFIYVADRKSLAKQINWIKSQYLDNRRLFYIHPTYDDALIRFRFIDKIMTILKNSYAPFFGFFLFILLLVQLSIVIDHRKHNYGILLAKGLSWNQILMLLRFQVTISFIVGFVLAFLTSEIMQRIFAYQLNNVVTKTPFIDHIVAGDLDLLPLAWLEYIIIGGGFFVLLIFVTTGLFRKIISRNIEPAYLFR
ncbi:ABC transporter permease [Candidatus Venteria ishoeyi]|uniref:ABC transporter permease n=1 Tax=Candidatus Venteria ishoeyi TaxID=1899563 RepID=UPI0025A60139|nr:ABC transporter permease [Candidatus Venteria ishoeyi]MDM8547871.1 ABC transporter permease [Candidatus Venteria ishoeyi]